VNGRPDEDPPSEGARPGETEEERADRNFNDLLQELRVSQTGVQILFGFLLTLPLQARFGTLDSYERTLLVLAVLFLAVATTCIIAPVAWHRALFRHRLTALALGIITSMLLMLDLVLPRGAAIALAGSLGVLILATWLVAPLRRQRGLTRR
jgi:hypothetical protein